MAAATLAALAGRRGVRVEAETGEEPGKIPHEERELAPDWMVAAGQARGLVHQGWRDATAARAPVAGVAWPDGRGVDPPVAVASAQAFAYAALRGHGRHEAAAALADRAVRELVRLGWAAGRRGPGGRGPGPRRGPGRRRPDRPDAGVLCGGAGRLGAGDPPRGEPDPGLDGGRGVGVGRRLGRATRYAALNRPEDRGSWELATGGGGDDSS